MVWPCRHHGTLIPRSARMMMTDAHVSGARRRRVVRACHRRRGGRVPVGRLRHLAARCEIAVRAGHVAEARGVHAGGGQGAARGVKAGSRGLV